MRIIHLVDQISRSNHGILEAAVGTAAELTKLGASSELWAPKESVSYDFDFRSVTKVLIDDFAGILSTFASSSRNGNQAGWPVVVVSHGAWQWPTRIAGKLQRLGAKWVCTPHGMLEPWSLKQRRLQKFLYFSLIEGPAMRRADVVRATSSPELENLKNMFERTKLIPNGVRVVSEFERLPDDKVRFLFMGRLHHKKNPVELAQAWVRSPLACSPSHELVIVGNDDGEQPKLQSVIDHSGVPNLRLQPPTYGPEKEMLFRSCDFFVLPSKSEGAPMALLEAMSAGLYPLISSGCNLPEAVDNDMACLTGTSVNEIGQGLIRLAQMTKRDLAFIRPRIRCFIAENYSEVAAARFQFNTFRSL